MSYIEENIMTEWFEEWFNTAEYLTVYRHRNEAEAGQLVSLILNNTNLPEGADILDMACGAGRHSILFALNGFNVTAVDLSNNLLNIARKAAVEAGIKINFIRADVRRFSVNKKFDLVVNLFTSFGYFSEDSENFKVLQNIYTHMKKGGYFVLDYLNEHYVEKNLVKFSVDDLTDGKIIQERYIEPADEGSGKRVIKKIVINKHGNERRYMESVRMFTEEELINKMHDYGFDIVKTFGDFNGNTFDKETSARIIILARKPG